MFQSEIEQVAYVPSTLVVGMPVMTSTYEDAEAQLNALPYKTYGIGAPLPDYKKEEYKQPTIRSVPTALPVPAALPAALPAPINNFNKAIFKVKASLAADNYQLYTNEDHFYETAMIPTYKCSVMMNTLFRNIKENANLDLLEESDDDEDFENTQIITRPTKISSLRDLPHK